MNKIILAGSGNDADLREGNLSRREQKQYERFSRHAVTVEKLPGFVARIVDPAFTAMHRSVRETDLALVALKEIIGERLNITDEEFEMKFNEIVERTNVTPNSPALAESQENAKGKVVSLQDGPENESVPRRTLEG